MTETQWIVNEYPRFSALEFGEYMAADDKLRETIRRDAKFQRLAPALLYTDVSHSVAQYFCSPTRDLKSLTACEEKLKADKAAARNPTQRDNVQHKLDALATFLRKRNELGLADVEAQHVSTHLPKVPLGDVEISTLPTLWLIRRRPRGADLGGAMLIDFAKGPPLKSEKTQARARDAMLWTARLLHYQATTHRCGEALKPSDELSFVYHLHRGERVAVDGGYKREWGQMEAACRTMLSVWPDIDPPKGFDHKQAKYRRRR